jgi:PEP-CTERM motif
MGPKLITEGSNLRMRIASLALLTIACLVLAVSPAMADTLYSNGPINGTTDAWTINFGFSVSDSFTLGADPKVRNLHMGLWLFPGDSLAAPSSVQIDIGTTSFGTDIFSEALSPSGSTDLGINQFGYDIQQVDFSLGEIDLPPGTYWLTASNATLPNGDPVYWDENSGVGCPSPGCPSSAFENTLGSIPSEAFTLTGDKGTTTPEPSSILLFASGILGVAGVLRRKLMG